LAIPRREAISTMHRSLDRVNIPYETILGGKVLA
jgi:hypothetical protein